MRKKTFISAFILAAITVLSLGSVGSVLAEDTRSNANTNEPAISISVLPAQQRLTLEPGETKTAEVTVVNSGNVEYEVKVYATPYTVSEDYTSNVFEGDTLPFSQIWRWISFDGKDTNDLFVLEPGTRKTIEFTIDVPESVPAGGQYAGIMAEVAPPTDATGIVSIRRVASLLYTNINGETIDKGEVTNRIWQSFHSNGDIKTSLTVKNLGNTDFAVENHLIVDNLFGRRVDEIIEPAKVILPDTSRIFELNWESKSPIGIYRLTQQTKFLDQTITETKLIFILPVWFIILALAVLIILIVIIINIIKKKKRRGRSISHAR